MRKAIEIDSRSAGRRRTLGRSLAIATVAVALTACAQDKGPRLALTDCAPASGTSDPVGCTDRRDIDDVVTGSLPHSGNESADKAGEPSPILADQTIETAKAPVDRSAVMPQVASASPDFTASISAKAGPSVVTPVEPADRAKPGPRSVPSLTLNDAVAIAVLSHPQMGAQAAKVQGVSADVRFAEGARLPQLEIYGGAGHATLGTFSNDPSMYNSGGAPGTMRADAGFTLRQLVFDFGAARSEVQRNQALVDAERLKLADQAEDIALRTVNAYLNLLEQRELISLIDHTVSEQRKLADLVKLSQQNGNGTMADVDRIKAKVIEIEAMRTDIDTAYHTALDEFHRLTNLEPRQVRRPKAVASLIPKNVGLAVTDANANNPSLLALKATGVSLGHQMAGQEATKMPRVDIQGDGLVKNYLGVASASQSVVDMRAMVMVTYKLFDGGTARAQEDHIRASQQQNEFKQLDEQETIELNLRRFYQSLAANRAKRAAAVSGVTTADNVNKLYIEQFKAGKRTIFEVLDSNMMVFTMQKNRINGEFEELRATYGILRNLGRLTETVARGG
jgi:outer membrane protein, adhesin transport system